MALYSVNLWNGPEYIQIGLKKEFQEDDSPQNQLIELAREILRSRILHPDVNMAHCALEIQSLKGDRTITVPFTRLTSQAFC